MLKIFGECTRTRKRKKVMLEKKKKYNLESDCRFRYTGHSQYNITRYSEHVLFLDDLPLISDPVPKSKDLQICRDGGCLQFETVPKAQFHSPIV